MKFQESVLRQYMMVSGNHSMKKIAKDTGLQISRIFRLFNGLEMKLKEYHLFYRKIQEYQGVEKNLSHLMELCILRLPPDSVKELEKMLIRKLKLWGLGRAYPRKRRIELFKEGV